MSISSTLFNTGFKPLSVQRFEQTAHNILKKTPDLDTALWHKAQTDKISYQHRQASKNWGTSRSQIDQLLTQCENLQRQFETDLAQLAEAKSDNKKTGLITQVAKWFNLSSRPLSQSQVLKNLYSKHKQKLRHTEVELEKTLKQSLKNVKTISRHNQYLLQTNQLKARLDTLKASQSHSLPFYDL